MTPPVINCPEDVTVNTDPGLYYATVNISMPTAFGTYIQDVPTSFRGQILSVLILLIQLALFRLQDFIVQKAPTVVKSIV